MKFSIVFLMIIANSLYAHSQTYIAEAQATASSTKRMTISFQNQVAHVSREDIAFDPNILSGIKDFASLGIVNGLFTIPDDGSTYWLVPFQGYEASVATSGDWCVDCFCQETGQVGQTPKCNLKSSNCGGSCGGCSTLTKPCGGTTALQGSFAIVRANQIVFD